jgi:endo-1,4-beta-D-glucanase Y
MNDKETFDKVYAFSQKNLKLTPGSILLSSFWHTNQTTISFIPLEANLDLALALIFASKKWEKDSLFYKNQAQILLSEILDKFTLKKDKTYLTPWPRANKTYNTIPIKPSCYSPYHFRVFYKETNNKIWLDLLDTSYFVLNSLMDKTKTIPDWYKMPNKSKTFGTESIKIPFKLGLDFVLTKNKNTQKFLNKKLKPFFTLANKNIPENIKNSSLFYSAYLGLNILNKTNLDKNLLNKTRSFIIKKDKNWVYDSEKDYLSNSFSWLIEYLISYQAD